MPLGRLVSVAWTFQENLVTAPPAEPSSFFADTRRESMPPEVMRVAGVGAGTVAPVGAGLTVMVAPTLPPSGSLRGAKRVTSVSPTRSPSGLVQEVPGEVDRPVGVAGGRS